MDVIEQQANFGTCYVVARVYSLKQRNAGRAHVELCHASSFPDYIVIGLRAGY